MPQPQQGGKGAIQCVRCLTVGDVEEQEGI